MPLFIKCRRAGNMNLRLFMAWCGFSPLTADRPIDEPQYPVFFEFGATEESAIEKLKKECASQGVTEWVRQKN